jgi:hypothetical protein
MTAPGTSYTKIAAPEEVEAVQSIVIKPYYGDYKNAWTYDGRTLKPYYGDYSKAWTFDGHTLKPYYGDNSKAWTFDGHTIRPYYGSYNRAYKADDDVPLPVMAKAAGVI